MAKLEKKYKSPVDYDGCRRFEIPRLAPTQVSIDALHNILWSTFSAGATNAFAAQLDAIQKKHGGTILDALNGAATPNSGK